MRSLPGDLVAIKTRTLRYKGILIGLIVGSHEDGRMLVFWMMKSGSMSMEFHEAAVLLVMNDPT